MAAEELLYAPESFGVVLEKAMFYLLPNSDPHLALVHVLSAPELRHSPSMRQATLDAIDTARSAQDAESLAQILSEVWRAYRLRV